MWFKLFVSIVLIFCAAIVADQTASNEGRSVGAIARQKCLEFPKVSAGTNHIIGGKIAHDGEFPYMAALGVEENGNVTFMCGASLISKDFLLTAAHCFKTRKLTIARFGAVKLFDPIPADPPVNINLQDPIYHREKHNHDIALVRLNRAINEDFIHPICLYTEPEDPEPKVDLTIAGWGVTDPNSEERYILMKGESVKVWPQEKCTKSIEDHKKQSSRLGKTLENMICASKLFPNGSTEVDSCSGDSGGPLELVRDSRRYLVGITSKGVSCGSKYPGYYTRVSSYIGWIESIVWPKEPK